MMSLPKPTFAPTSRPSILLLGLVFLTAGLAGCTVELPEKGEIFVDEPEVSVVDQPEDTGFVDTPGDTAQPPPPDTSMPPDTAPPPPPPGRPTGSACRDADQCTGNTCLPADEFPGGYCTDESCRGCSGNDALCVDLRDQVGTTRCLDGCESDAECRDGYTCRVIEGFQACLPEEDEPDPQVSFNQTRKVLDVKCNPTQSGQGMLGQNYEFTFTVGQDAGSFLMVPYVKQGRLRPVSLEMPTTTIDLQTGYRHHNGRLSGLQPGANSDLTGIGTFGKIAFDWPITVPYAPRFNKYVTPGGTYTLTVTADRDTPCLYTLDSKPQGRNLDLNFYMVGASGIDAASAASDSDLQAAIGEFRHIYGKVGVKIDKIRYYDVPDDVVRQYRRVTSREGTQKLMAYGKPPGKSLDDHLSVDVFLVDEVRIRDSMEGGDVLGISNGIPGAAGMHGNSRDGLIFETKDLGRANKHVGHIMAHEIGHFLGLRHTTEIVHDTRQAPQVERLLGTTDPINDTAVCDNIRDQIQQDPFGCGDFDNLMFPVAPPPRLMQDARLTTGQGAAMVANPLIRK